jgi:hypothetical protein
MVQDPRHQLEDALRDQRIRVMSQDPQHRLEDALRDPRIRVTPKV